MANFQKYVEAAYDTREKIALHTNNVELFSVLYNDIATKNQKEKQFFAYIVTQIESLLEKYPELIVLRDIDETTCYRTKPEEWEPYDVIRSGFLPTLEHLTKKYPTQLEFWILSRRPADFLQETFVHKTNSDRPKEITNFLSPDQIFSSRKHSLSRCPKIYECKNKSNVLIDVHINKANAYHDISNKNPDKKYILVDDCIGFWQKYVAQFDRHIPFPHALTMGEEDAIMQKQN